jgi:Flp pilus assembly protein TadD
LQAALRARPALIGARLNLALLHARRRRFQQAVDGYRDVLADRPEHSGAWNGIGQVLMELKQFADARNAFARARSRRTPRMRSPITTSASA